MSFQPPPELPSFIDFPVDRRLFRLPAEVDPGQLLHFVDHGPRQGRPVLMLHGNPTWSYLWRKVIARLPEMRCVAPDLLGCGLSSKLPAYRDHSVARHADAVAALVAELDLRNFVLLGQDWGGPIATATAARLPERVGALVLGNTAVLLPERLRGTAFHRFARTPLVSDLAFRVLGFPLRSLHKTQGDPRSISGDVARAYRWPLRRMRERVAPLALARMVPDSLDHPSIPEIRRGEAWLRSFEGPTALVWGERDPILGRGLRRHAAALPRARVTRTQAGHFLQEEVPEEIAAAIRDVAAG